jgi:hypothetical protein
MPGFAMLIVSSHDLRSNSGRDHPIVVPTQQGGYYHWHL